MRYNKADLIKALAQDPRNAGLSQARLTEVVDSLVQAVKGMLKEPGDELGLVGFGRFMMVETAARTGRNPQTGETMQIPAKKALKFRAAKA